jgi:hypothetical protein
MQERFEKLLRILAFRGRFVGTIGVIVSLDRVLGPRKAVAWSQALARQLANNGLDLIFTIFEPLSRAAVISFPNSMPCDKLSLCLFPKGTFPLR